MEGALERRESWWRSGTAAVVAIAVGTVVVHLVTGWRYGFDRDELMAVEDARHLAWGYVQYPPMTAFFGRVALLLFGTSLVGFRFFAAVAQAAAVVLTGLMAKELGGGKWGQVTAALAGVPFCLGGGALMQYISFDYVCWVWVAYCMVRVLRGEDRKSRIENRKPEEQSEEQQDQGILRSYKEEPKTHPQKPRMEHPEEEADSSSRPSRRNDRLRDARWWVGVGVGIGLGMLAKYTMGFLAAGVVVGVLATDARKYLKSGWLWLGVVVACGIFWPNFVWEWKRHFVSLEFLKFLHERDVQAGLTDWFLLGQVEVALLALPLALAGIYFCFLAEEGKRYRVLGWMYAAPLVLFLVMRGRDYYLAPAYPMLYAAGAVWVERKVGRRRSNKENRKSKMVRRAIWVALILDVMVAGAVALPIAPVNSRWWKFAGRVDSVFAEEIGWPEFVESVARVRERLPTEEWARVGILAGNYGELGALNFYGERYGLPRAISGVNSSWERGYGSPAPETVIVTGYSRDFLEKHFASCEVAARTWNRFGVMNEETIEDPEIFVCRGLKESWEEFWKGMRRFA